MFKGLAISGFEYLKSKAGALYVTSDSPSDEITIHLHITQTGNGVTLVYTPPNGAIFHIKDLIVSWIGENTATSVLIEYYCDDEWVILANLQANKNDDGNFSHSYGTDLHTDPGNGTNMVRVTGNVPTVYFNIGIMGHLE